MRVAVTGVTGFVGGAVARRLARDGVEVVGLGRRPDPGRSPGGYVRWDLGDGSSAPPLLRDVDAVIHAAARVAPWGEDEPFERETVGGTRRLLDATGAGTRLIVIGSASVYPPSAGQDANGEPVREADAPVDAARYRTAYARAKAAQERLVLERRPDALVLRPRAVWGPGDRTLLPRVLARVRRGVLPLPAGGRLPGSFTAVDTLVDAVLAGLGLPTVAGPVNVADATPRPPAALITALGLALGTPIRIVPVPVPAADAMAMALEAVHRAARSRREPVLTRYAVDAFARPLVLDLSQLHARLGIAPDRDPEEGIAAVAGSIAAARAAGVHRGRT